MAMCIVSSGGSSRVSIVSAETPFPSHKPHPQLAHARVHTVTVRIFLERDMKRAARQSSVLTAYFSKKKRQEGNKPVLVVWLTVLANCDSDCESTSVTVTGSDQESTQLLGKTCFLC